MSTTKMLESLDKKRQEVRDLTKKLRIKTIRDERIAQAKQRALQRRREMLLGLCLAHAIETDQIDESQVLAWLDASLTRDKDRLFFGLPVDGDLTSH